MEIKSSVLMKITILLTFTFDEINDPKALADELIHMVGIVETGLFLNRVNDVIVGTPEGPKVPHAR